MSQTIFFSSNLKFLRERQKISQQQLADILSIKRSKLAAYEIGQTKNPPLIDLIAISDHFNLPIDMMTKADISKLPELQLQEIEGNKNTYNGRDMRVVVTTVNSENNENIEFVPIKAKAGYLDGFNNPVYISKLPVFNLPHLPKNKKYRMFPTEGDSMYPFPEKSLIVGEFIEDWYSIKPDTPCIIVTKTEGIVFKQVTSQLEGKKTFYLKSLNPLFKPYEVAVENVCEIWKYTCYLSDYNYSGEITTEQLWLVLNSIKEELKEVKKRA